MPPLLWDVKSVTGLDDSLEALRLGEKPREQLGSLRVVQIHQAERRTPIVSAPGSDQSGTRNANHEKLVLSIC